MNYGFYYLDNNLLYLQIGFGLNSKKKAKLKLEEIAHMYCRKKGDRATGEIHRIENEELIVVKKYKVYYKGRIRLKERR